MAGSLGFFVQVERIGVVVVGIYVFPSYRVVVEVVGAVQEFFRCRKAVGGQPVAFCVVIFGDAYQEFGGGDAVVGLVADELGDERV